MDDLIANQMTKPARVEHLLAAARKAFVTYGFAGVSIDAIARDSGVSKETIYRHYSGKKDLFQAALEDFASEFTGRVESAHRHSPLAVDELTSMARAILDSADTGGLLSPMWLAADVAGQMPEFAEEMTQAQWQRLEPVRLSLERVAQQRGISAEVPLEIALDFGSLAVEGPAMLLGFECPNEQTREIVSSRVAHLFDKGILAVGETAHPVPSRPKQSHCANQEPAAHIRVLLDVAARHFLQTGFHGANLAKISAEARVGRGTLYRHFSSKAGLFAAALSDLAEQLASAAKPPALRLDQPPQETLREFVTAAVRSLAAPDSVALHRVAIASSRRDPELTRMVHDRVRDPWIRPLAQWITRVTGAADAEWLAGQLLVLALQGNRLFAAGRILPADQIPVHSERVVAIFLHGFTASLER